MYNFAVVDKWGGNAIVGLFKEHYHAKRFADLYEGFEAEEAKPNRGEEPLPSTDKGRHPDDPEFDAVCDALWDKYGV